MGRNKLPDAAATAPPFDANVDADDRRAATALAKMEGEATKRAKELATQVGYEGSLDPDIVAELVKTGMRRTAESAFATGMALLMLREVTPHGQLRARLEQIGIEQRLAQRLMSAAEKLRKSGNLPLLLAQARNTQKLLELTWLDENQLDMLAEGGAVNGVTLDKLDTMTARELREALREKEAELEVSQGQRKKLQTRLDKADAEKRLIKKLPPDERLAKLHQELAVIAHTAFAAVRGELEPAIAAVRAHHDEHGGNSDIQLASAIAGVQRELNHLRETYVLPDVSNAADEALMRQMAALDKQP
jgi:hypothetical protein